MEKPNEREELPGYIRAWRVYDEPAVCGFCGYPLELIMEDQDIRYECGTCRCVVKVWGVGEGSAANREAEARHGIE
jgi:hypothetical protein